MENIIVSFIISIIVCGGYSRIIELQYRRWLNEFFEEETKRIKSYLSRDK